MHHLLEQIANTQVVIHPEDFLLRLTQIARQVLPVLVANIELLSCQIGSTLTQFLGGIDGHDEGGMKSHVFDIVKLLFSFGIAFNHYSLDLTILLAYSLLNQFFNQKIIDKFIIQKLVFDFSAVDGIFSDLLCYQETCRDVNEVVELCYFFA